MFYSIKGYKSYKLVLLGKLLLVIVIHIVHFIFSSFHTSTDAQFCVCVSWFRLQALWHAELKKKGRDGASLSRVFWRFCRTRFLVALLFLLIYTVTTFIGPVSISHLYSLTAVFWACIRINVYLPTYHTHRHTHTLNTDFRILEFKSVLRFEITY